LSSVELYVYNKLILPSVAQSSSFIPTHTHIISTIFSLTEWFIQQ